MVTPATITTVSLSGPPDAHGVAGEVVTQRSVRCWLHQTQRSEQTAPVGEQAETWSLYLPVGTVVSGEDRITVGSDVFELTGPPWPVLHPTSQKVTHVEATVKRVR